jgi:hypothetical protein
MAKNQIHCKNGILGIVYPDTMSRHLTVLRSVGAIIAVPSPDGDTRKQHQSVPERFRRTDEAGKPMIDYGVCVLRFP